MKPVNTFFSLHKLQKFILLGFTIALTAGCAALPGSATTPAASAPITTSPAAGTLIIDGLRLTNGTYLITRAPQNAGLKDDLLVIHDPAATAYLAGSLVEFTIRDAIAESYPPQAQGIKSRLISETSPVIKVSIARSSQIKMHMPRESILIDVRTPQEYQSGYIPEAINIPVDQIAQEISKKVKGTEQTLMVYCRSGSRSAQAAAKLKELGYRIVLDLGGIIDYKEDLVK